MSYHAGRKVVILGITAVIIVSVTISLDNCVRAVTVPIKTINNKYGFSSSTQLVGTFYYGWYTGQDQGYRSWDNGNHNPPFTWASNYLPDMGHRPNTFDPTHNLYESNDQYILLKQLGWMKEAGIQFGISDWWGIGSTTDRTFSYIMNKIMPSTTNSYPSFKWAIVYDLERSDPPVKKLVSDLSYIKENYASSPYYLKIDGKPVMFVYNTVGPGSNALNDLERWSIARQSTGFYTVMKVDPLNMGANPNSMDGWYDYNPSMRYGQLDRYYAYVSPGFWNRTDNAPPDNSVFGYYFGSPTKNTTSTAGKSTTNTTSASGIPLLARNVTDFEIAVQKLASANVHFKLVETWNEYLEGTQIEPAMQITPDYVHGFRPQSASYGNIYISILGKYLSEHTTPHTTPWISRDKVMTIIPEIPPTGTFGYYFGPRTINATVQPAITNTHKLH